MKQEAETLEEILAGDYGGLYGEVVVADTYRLRQVEFQPDIIFDIGANIGIFSRYARELFPKALVIAVEPNPGNCNLFRRFAPPDRLILVQMALGRGTIFHGLTARNGSGETYLSAGLGYPYMDMVAAVRSNQGLVFSDVPPIELHQLIYGGYWRPGMKTLVKIDCEGAENSIWESPLSMLALKKVDYLAMEIHDYALNGNELSMVKEKTQQALQEFESTHYCERKGVHFWATKKP